MHPEGQTMPRECESSFTLSAERRRKALESSGLLTDPRQALGGTKKNDRLFFLSLLRQTDLGIISLSDDS